MGKCNLIENMDSWMTEHSFPAYKQKIDQKIDETTGQPITINSTYDLYITCVGGDRKIRRWVVEDITCAFHPICQASPRELPCDYMKTRLRPMDDIYCERVFSDDKFLSPKAKIIKMLENDALEIFQNKLSRRAEKLSSIINAHSQPENQNLT